MYVMYIVHINFHMVIIYQKPISVILIIKSSLLLFNKCKFHYLYILIVRKVLVG